MIDVLESHRQLLYALFALWYINPGPFESILGVDVEPDIKVLVRECYQFSVK